MKVLEQTVHIDDEGRFQDILSGTGVGAQSTRDSLRRLIEDGAKITVQVPGMPARGLVTKGELARVTGIPLPEDASDLVAIPLGS